MNRLGYNYDCSLSSNKTFPDNTICLVGNARTANDNPITYTYSHFFIAFVVMSDTGEIIDLDASFTLSLTNRFIRDLFLGSSLRVIDDDVLYAINNRYFGSSQKAIAVAYKDAVKKYSCFVHRPDR